MITACDHDHDHHDDDYYYYYHYHPLSSIIIHYHPLLSLLLLLMMMMNQWISKSVLRFTPSGISGARSKNTLPGSCSASQTMIPSDFLRQAFWWIITRLSHHIYMCIYIVYHSMVILSQTYHHYGRLNHIIYIQYTVFISPCVFLSYTQDSFCFITDISEKRKRRTVPGSGVSTHFRVRPCEL